MNNPTVPSTKYWDNILISVPSTKYLDNFLSSIPTTNCWCWNICKVYTACFMLFSKYCISVALQGVHLNFIKVIG